MQVQMAEFDFLASRSDILTITLIIKPCTKYKFTKADILQYFR